MKSLFLLAFLTGSLMGGPLAAGNISFDELKPGEQVLAFYDGGFGSLGTGPGPTDGVTFTPGLAADATVIAFGQSALITGTSVTMNLDTAYSGFVSFYFTGAGKVAFYSGQNGTGNLLSSYILTYPPFFPFGANLNAFQSAVFVSNVANTVRLDSITFGGAVIPEPASVWLMIAAGVLMAVRRHSAIRSSNIGRFAVRGPRSDR